MLSFVLEFRLVYQLFGAAPFGVYSSLRRIVNRGIPFVSLCLGMAVSRFLAQEKEAQAAAPRYLRSYVQITLASFLVFSFSLWISPRSLLEPFFGENFSDSFIGLLLIMSLAALAFDCTYSIFRGLHQYAKANISALLVSSLIPLSSIALFSSLSLKVALSISSVATMIVCSVFLRTLLRKKAESEKKLSRKLLKFSMPRVPGVLLNGALFIIPTWHFAKQSSLAELGYFNAILSLAGLATAAAEPLGRVLYTTFSSLSADGISDRVKRSLSELVGLSLTAGLFLSAIFGLFASSFLKIWLGNSAEISAALVQILGLGLFGICLFELLWRPIDAIKEFPYLLITTGFGLLIYFIVGFYFGFTQEAICWAWTAGRIAQGFSSLLILLRVTRLKMPRTEVMGTISLCILCFFAQTSLTVIGLLLTWTLCLILLKPSWLQRLLHSKKKISSG